MQLFKNVLLAALTVLLALLFKTAGGSWYSGARMECAQYIIGPGRDTAVQRRPHGVRPGAGYRRHQT